jgi:nucleoside-diphosphate-sugar epimerase
MRTILVTGSNGLIGSTVVSHFHDLGWTVHGVENNLRAGYFGPQRDTRWVQRQLIAAGATAPPSGPSGGLVAAQTTPCITTVPSTRHGW